MSKSCSCMCTLDAKGNVTDTCGAHAENVNKAIDYYIATTKNQPIPMLLFCPWCGHRHIDEGEFATKSHHTHACQTCGMVWRPAIVPTVGVVFLPGFKNEGDPE